MLRVTQELIEWYRIKDLIIRQDLRDIPKALELARSSKHPDAIWLSNVFDDFDVGSVYSFCETLKPYLRFDDPNALFFYSLLRDDPTSFQKCVSLGHLHAKWYVEWDDQTTKELADKGERDACYSYGKSYNDFKYIEYAAKLGHFFAMMEMASHYSIKTVEGWDWLCFSAEYGYDTDIDCNSDAPSAIRYMCGKRLINSQHKSFYLSQNLKCRKAVDMWTFIATRMRICKDLRKLIGGMIWDSRSEGLFK